MHRLIHRLELQLTQRLAAFTNRWRKNPSTFSRIRRNLTPGGSGEGVSTSEHRAVISVGWASPPQVMRR